MLGCAAATAPCRASAAAPLRRIGFLSISSPEFDVPVLSAFRDGLARLGYVDGRTVEIDPRWSQGDVGALTDLARELVQLKTDVVLANAISPTRAMKRVAPSLPIVCPAFNDSFVPSLAASFSHPGGSVTGIASLVEGMAGKLVEVVHDTIPGITKLGLLVNPTGASTPDYEKQVRATSEARGVALQIEHVAKPDDIEAAVRSLGGGQVQAVIVPGNGLVNSHLKEIVDLALALRLPLFFSQRYDVAAGGLASYGVDSLESYRSAATYIDKILKGTAPGDLPIEFPTKLELVINLKTAKALGLAIPAAQLDRADQVIE